MGESKIYHFLARVSELARAVTGSPILDELRIPIASFAIEGVLGGEVWSSTVQAPDNPAARLYVALHAGSGTRSFPITTEFVEGVAELVGEDLYKGLIDDPRYEFLRGVLLGSHVTNIVWKAQGEEAEGVS